MLSGSLLKINEEDVTNAFERLIRFQTINDQRDTDAKCDGLSNYCESVGLTGGIFTDIYQRCEFVWGDEAAPLMCIAVLLGLAMAESYLDKK